MTSNKPYLFRAMQEWILDNDMTPYVLIDASHEDVNVPVDFIQDGKIVLNVSPAAIDQLFIDSNGLSFNARFSGTVYSIFAPLQAVLAIYARENGKGMVFPDDTDDSMDGEKDLNTDVKRPNLKIVK